MNRMESSTIGHVESRCTENFYKEATDIICDLSERKQPRSNIYVNVIHAVDGAWNFNSQALSNDAILNEVKKD